MEQQEKVQPMYTQELDIRTIGLLKATKSDISDKVKQAVFSVQEGNFDKLDAFIFAKKLETLGKDLATALKPIAEEVPITKDYVRFNTSITEGMQGVKWDYSETGDKEYKELTQQAKELDVKIKVREKFLQGITKPLELVDIESGETHTINPPVKSGSLGFTVKLK